MRRRALLATVGASGIGILAGCSDSGSSGDDGGGNNSGNDSNNETGESGDETTENGSDSGNGGEPTLTTSGPADGEVASNAIAELAVVMLESQAETVFSVTVTLENTGDQRTSAMNYTYTLALFDGDGNELGTVVANKANLGARMTAGQQGSVIATAQFYDGEPSDVARYELTIDCSEEESEDRGVYCS